MYFAPFSCIAFTHIFTILKQRSKFSTFIFPFIWLCSKITIIRLIYCVLYACVCMIVRVFWAREMIAFPSHVKINGHLWKHTGFHSYTIYTTRGKRENEKRDDADRENIWHAITRAKQKTKQNILYKKNITHSYLCVLCFQTKRNYTGFKVRTSIRNFGAPHYSNIQRERVRTS